MPRYIATYKVIIPPLRQYKGEKVEDKIIDYLIFHHDNDKTALAYACSANFEKQYGRFVALEKFILVFGNLEDNSLLG